MTNLTYFSISAVISAIVNVVEANCFWSKQETLLKLPN